MNGMVYLVGAGCGGRELLTLKAQALLNRCDTVVYDALIDPEILIEAPRAEKVAVGKRAGRHSESQEKINEILVKKASEGKTVVRLKGGDPFVFGRGGEEALILERNHIPYSVVPGVSSCIAAPELAGIPVTHRGTARSFHVITAHTSEGLQNASKYAFLDGTLVFLMGLSNIWKIAGSLTDGGMPSETPAAVISKAGSPEQTTIRGCLSDIAAKVTAARLETPAVFVVGKTAAYELSGTEQLPLHGVTVAVTGTEHFVQKLTAGLSGLGASVRTAAVLHAHAADTTALDTALKNIGSYSLLVFTSVCGAKIFLGRMRALELDIRSLGSIGIAVSGGAADEYLRSFGLIPSLVSAGSGEMLAREIVSRNERGRVLILRAKRGSQTLTDILAENNIPFADLRIYDVDGESTVGEIRTDFIVFASPSGVECFFSSSSLSPKTTAVCIGELTADAFRACSSNRVITAEELSAEGIIKAIMEEIQ